MFIIFLYNDFLLSAKDSKSVHGEAVLYEQYLFTGTESNIVKITLLLSKLKLTSVTCLEEVTFFLRDSLFPCLIKKLILLPAL